MVPPGVGTATGTSTLDTTTKTATKWDTMVTDDHAKLCFALEKTRNKPSSIINSASPRNHASLASMSLAPTHSSLVSEVAVSPPSPSEPLPANGTHTIRHCKVMERTSKRFPTSGRTGTPVASTGHTPAVLPPLAHTGRTGSPPSVGVAPIGSIVHSHYEKTHNE